MSKNAFARARKALFWALRAIGILLVVVAALAGVPLVRIGGPSRAGPPRPQAAITCVQKERP